MATQLWIPVSWEEIRVSWRSEIDKSILGHSDETVSATVPCIVLPLMRCGVLSVAALALLQLPTGVGAAFVNFSAATAAASFIGAQNRTYIGE